MKRFASVLFTLLVVPATVLSSAATSSAQDLLPEDNGLTTYHTSPRYRESESHPLRILGYVLHPVGWLAREAVFRPFSYLASSTETTRSIMGYREPFDYRRPECFSADDSAPDCRSVAPFNYETIAPLDSLDPAPVVEHTALNVPAERQVYFPDVNFEFNSRQLSDLGRGQVRRIAQQLEQAPGLRIVLQGNTDYIGSDEYNERLGMDRAESVRQELVSLGVPADRISTVTFGEAQPIFADEANWARAVNRRVEVKLGE